MLHWHDEHGYIHDHSALECLVLPCCRAIDTTVSGADSGGDDSGAGSGGDDSGADSGGDESGLTVAVLGHSDDRD